MYTGEPFRSSALVADKALAKKAASVILLSPLTMKGNQKGLIVVHDITTYLP